MKNKVFELENSISKISLTTHNGFYNINEVAIYSKSPIIPVILTRKDLLKLQEKMINIEAESIDTEYPF